MILIEVFFNIGDLCIQLIKLKYKYIYIEYIPHEVCIYDTAFFKFFPRYIPNIPK